MRRPVVAVAAALLHAEQVDDAETVAALDVRQMGGDVGEGGEADHFAMLVVDQSRVLAVSPPGARVAVDVGKDLQRKLPAQVGNDVDASAAGGIFLPLAAAAGMHPLHAVIVVTQLVEPVYPGQRLIGCRAAQFHFVVADVRFAGVAVVRLAAVDAQQVAPAPRRQVEREVVRGAAGDVGEGTRQRRVELLGGEHALQEQVGVVAHVVQVVAGRGDQQAHHRAAGGGVAVPLGALREAFQAAHRRAADGGVEVERRVGAAGIQLAQKRLPAGRGDAHRAARRRQFLVRWYETARRFPQRAVQRIQGSALPVVERLDVRVAGLDGALLQAQDQPERIARGAVGVLLGGRQVEQPQPEIEGRHAVAHRTLSDPREHGDVVLFMEEGCPRRFADQHDAPVGRRRGGTAAVVRQQQVVGQADGIGKPLHEPRIALQPFTRRRAAGRGSHHRLDPNRLRQPLPLIAVGARPRRTRGKRECALFPERGAQRCLDRRIVHVGADRHRQAGAAPDARNGAAINFIRIHRFSPQKSEWIPLA